MDSTLFTSERKNEYKLTSSFKHRGYFKDMKHERSACFHQKLASVYHMQNQTYDCLTPLSSWLIPDCNIFHVYLKDKSKQTRQATQTLDINGYLIHELTFVYLAMHTFCPKWGQPQTSQTRLVQPHWLQWDFFQYAKSTGLGYCRVREKQLRTQKRATLLKPYTSGTLPVHSLQRMLSQRTSIRNSSLQIWNHSKPND